jgi:RimJ/RimL family protein N-acetyltransferase
MKNSVARAYPGGLTYDDPNLVIAHPIITLRPAIIDDASLLFAWQQHPDTRRYARDTKPPAWPMHIQWLAHVLIDPLRTLYVIEQKGYPVGCLRLDTTEEDTEISIVIAPGRHREGLGRAALTELQRRHPQLWLAAEVLPDNVASHALFQSAGFYLLPGENWYISNPTVNKESPCQTTVATTNI